MFECNNVCVPCKFLDMWTNFESILFDACVFNDDTSVLYTVFVSTNMTDVVGGNICEVSMQLIAVCLSFVWLISSCF